jgi:hypothetical protein
MVYISRSESGHFEEGREFDMVLCGRSNVPEAWIFRKKKNRTRKIEPQSG